MSHKESLTVFPQLLGSEIPCPYPVLLSVELYGYQMPEEYNEEN